MAKTHRPARGFRPVALWVSLAAAIFLSVLCVASYVFVDAKLQSRNEWLGWEEFAGLLFEYSDTNGDYYAIAPSRGVVEILLAKKTDASPPYPDVIIRWAGWGYDEFVMMFASTGSRRWVTRLKVPLWFLILAAFAYPTLVVIRRWRRKRHGWCLVCGYDLTANTSGACPECGQSAEQMHGAN